MPQVPVLSDNQQTLGPISGARFDAPDVGAAGRTLAGGLQNFGQTVTEVAAAFNARSAEAGAKALDNEWVTAEQDDLFGEHGFYSNELGDAANAVKPLADRLAERRSGLLARARSPLERSLLTDVLNKRQQQTLEGAHRYAQGQEHKFNIVTAETRRDLAIGNAVRFYGVDQQASDDNLTTALREVSGLADLRGFNDGKLVEAERESVRTKVWGGVIEKTAVGDAAGAMALLEQHAAEMAPAVVIDYRAKLQPRVEDSLSRGFSTAIDTNFRTNVVATPVTGSTIPAADAATAEATPLMLSQGITVPDMSLPKAKPTHMVAINTVARPEHGLSRVRGAFPLSYRDPLYDRLDAQMETKYGLPPGLLRSVRVNGERTNSDRVSPMGARGPYQFVPATRQGFISHYGIDPYNSPAEQAEAAAIHLRDDIKKHGSWRAAVAGYNGGGAAAKAVARGGQPPARETRDYLRRVEGGMNGTPDGIAVPINGTPASVAASDLENRLNLAETYIPEVMAGQPPDVIRRVVDLTKADLRRKYAERKGLIDEREREQADNAWKTASSLGSGFTDPRSQIANFSDLPGTTQMSLLNNAESNVRQNASDAKPKEVETNLDAYRRYHDMPVEELRRVPNAELTRVLGKTEYKEIIDRLEGKPGNPQKAVTTREILTYTENALHGAGYATGDSSAARTAQPQVNAFARKVMMWAEGVHQKTGKWPDEEHIRRQGDRFLIEGDYKDADGNWHHGRAFEADRAITPTIPPEIEKTIRRALGSKATPAQISAAYIEGKGLDW